MSNYPDRLAKAQALSSIYDGEEDSTENLFRRQFDVTSTPAQRKQMESLARAAGREISKETILRPHILVFENDGWTADDASSREFPIQFNNQFDFYVVKVTCTIGAPVLKDNAIPSAIFNQFITPLDYVYGDWNIGGRQKLTEARLPFSHLAGTGSLPYFWDILPFLPRRTSIDIKVEVAEQFESATSFFLSFHGLVFGLV